MDGRLHARVGTVIVLQAVRIVALLGSFAVWFAGMQWAARVNVVKVPVGSEEDVVKTAALADSRVAARLEGKTVVKVIVVPGKLVNLVVK